MGWKLYYFICGSMISTACFAKYKKLDIYNNVYVTFPDDPCDDATIEMPDFSAIRRSISDVKCLEHVWRVRCEQGKEIRRATCLFKTGDTLDLTPILGGSDVSYGEYPHMGALGWKARVGTWIFKCGGSLISERFVLTAAHCSCVPSTDNTVTDLEPKIVRLGCKNIMDVHISPECRALTTLNTELEPKIVILGCKNYMDVMARELATSGKQEFQDKGEPAYDVSIRRFISHHRYNPPRQYYDIALVELDQEVSFRWNVHPACLWNRFENPEQGTVTGWGVIETASLTTSPELQKADVMIIESDDCDDMLEKKRNLRKWWGIVSHQLCAGDSNGRIDTCRGDSGGPLQKLISLRHSSPFNRWKLHQIIGVTSFGFGCARPNTPSIYTRVANFVTWIESIVWPSNRTIENRLLFKI